MDNHYIPQWLKETLNRGYRPSQIYHDFDNVMFAYINPHSNTTILAPTSKSYDLEGLPGAGKTTLLNRIGDKYKFISTVEQILPFNPIDDQSMNPSFYFQSEELKTEKIRDNIVGPTLLDRYYVSTLAFYWASDRINGTNNYQAAHTWYKSAVQQGRIWKPFMTFYIEVDPILSIERKGRYRDSRSQNIWENAIFLKIFGDYYKYFFTEIEPQSTVKYLSSSLTLDQLEKYIVSEIYER